ncbi:Swi snf matrix actin dependent regulator of subfamily a, partial [Globisporangium splendens]
MWAPPREHLSLRMSLALSGDRQLRSSMTEMQTAQRARAARVEKKGRFTITEILPGSPHSPAAASGNSAFPDDAADESVAAAGCVAPNQTFVDSLVVAAAAVLSDVSPPPECVPQETMEMDVVIQTTTIASASPLEPAHAEVSVLASTLVETAVEELAPGQQRTSELEQTVVSEAGDASQLQPTVPHEEVMPEQRTMDEPVVDYGSIAPVASETSVPAVASAVVEAAPAPAVAPDSPFLRASSSSGMRRESLGLDDSQGASDRRFFFAVESAPFDHVDVVVSNHEQLPSQTFSTTTTVSVSTEFEQSQQQQQQQLSSETPDLNSPLDLRSSFIQDQPAVPQEGTLDTQRRVRSMSSLHDEALRDVHLLRVRGESPIRAPMDIQELGGEPESRNGGIEDPSAAYTAASCGDRPYVHRRTQSSTRLHSRTSSTTTTVEAHLENSASSFVGSSSSTGFLTPVSSSVPSDRGMFASEMGTERRRAPEVGIGRKHLASRQKTITISATQFLQQQDTIAALIRQQQELKHIIGVLHEQQQQLMSVPTQLNELKMEHAQGDEKDEIVVDSLMRANDSVHGLLAQAEKDAQDRAQEVDSLTAENEQLRIRCQYFEEKYIEERKATFILEEEVQRFRKLTLTHELEQRHSVSMEQTSQDDVVLLALASLNQSVRADDDDRDDGQQEPDGADRRKHRVPVPSVGHFDQLLRRISVGSDARVHHALHLYGSVPPIDAMSVQAPFHNDKVDVAYIPKVWQKCGVDRSDVSVSSVVDGSGTLPPSDRARLFLGILEVGSECASRAKATDHPSLQQGLRSSLSIPRFFRRSLAPHCPLLHPHAHTHTHPLCTVAAMAPSISMEQEELVTSQQQQQQQQQQPKAVEEQDGNAQETATKLAKLDTLLEKAGLYSSFLFSNMATAATTTTVPTDYAVKDEDVEEHQPTGKRKRTRTVKKAKDGEKKLKEMQSDTKLDTRQQPHVEFAQPKLLTGGALRDYQLEGIRWLCNLFENGLNGILADEMGLGKTIQVIGLIAHLKSLGVRGPYLITAPLSTLLNWEKEFHKWAPDIPCFVYHGTQTQRRAIRKNELKSSKKHDMDFPVVITSYEMILQDAKSFNSLSFVWKYIIIDEGHRLKNMDCKLVRELKRARSENRLLLTGTPLQNNLIELWALLNFILPDVFDDLDLFESWFSFTPDGARDGTAMAQDVLAGTKKAEIVTKLHEILRPFLLRRLKVDVVDEMPSKTEIFVYCPMSTEQREYYAMILNRTLQDAMEAKYGKFRGAAFKTNSVRNRAMQLRKCCNHPYLFDEPLNASGELDTDERMVHAAGKLEVMDKMLKRLKRDGHKVLIFSQMTNVLDILEDYMGLRGYSFCRLDGSTDLRARQEQMDAFNKKNGGSDGEDIFCFLLSTRAGGLGINLISADTVIFYDSDWNPQQDNQAQDRCHRLGQTKEIVVYRLVTENSFENRMIARAIEKRKLERVVIQRGQFKQQNHYHQHRRGDDDDKSALKTLTNEELDELLKDDVLIRNGIESGGIQDDELNQILDRDLVVKSFVKKDAKHEETAEQAPQKKSKTTTGSKKSDDDAVVLERKGNGYEVVENATTTAMESFA